MSFSKTINNDINSKVLDGCLPGNYYEDCEKNHYQVSLLIGTYNPDFKKLYTTINSGLIQENIDLQIVVSDDGSKSFEINRVIDFFESKHFHNYVVISLKTNSGTNKNFNNALKYCKGEYTKLLSPGDYLYGQDCLASWYDYIIKNNAVVSFSDCIHYCYENDSIKAIAVKADPQNTKDFYKNSWAYNYLVFDDIVTGACTLTKTDILLKYTDMLLDKVIYAEDNVYRLMAYRNETACYFDRDAVLYEHNVGVSADGNKKWLDIIFNEYVAADSIMLEWKDDSIIAKQFAKIADIRKEKRVVLRKFKVLFFLLSSGKISFVLKRRFKPRYTNVIFEKEYVKKIHSFDLNL